MNQNAYKEIKNIAQNTHCIDQQAIALQLQLAFEGMSKRIPSCAEEIENLRIRFQSKLKDLEIPLVFFHGDLKLENFLLDENNCIKSIIDFELSKVRGPIMLDLLYLLAYNRRMVLGERFTSTILFFLDNKFSDIEMEFINDFREEFNISDEVFKILLVIFFVHHFGIRYQVGLSKTESISRFRDALKTVLSLI